MIGKPQRADPSDVRAVALPPDEMSELRLLGEQFDVVADALNGVAALRRVVLELAVRGRLSGGLPTATSTSEGPFPLPEGWRWASGREVFSFVTSGSRGWAEFYADDGPLFLRIGNLDYETTDLDLTGVQRVRPPKAAEGVRTRVEPGDILISITGDTGMVGLVPAGLGEAYINQHIALARPASFVLPAFIARALTAPSLLGRLQGAQRGIKNSLGLDDVRGLAIPVPPLVQQKQIVAKVDQLMAFCDDLEARQTKKREIGTRLTKSALEALTTAAGPVEFDAAWRRVVDNFDVLVDQADKVDELRGAVMFLALRGGLSPAEAGRSALADLGGHRELVAEAHHPYPIPEGWAWLYMDQVFASITDGDHQPPPKVPGGVPFLTIGNVSGGRLDFSDTRFVPREYFDGLDPRRVPARGDILYTVVGSYGIPVAVEDRREFCVQRHIAILRPDGSCDPDYLFMFLNSPIAYRQATAAVTGTAQPTVPLRPLRRFKVPLPPRAEQTRIVAKVKALIKLCDDLEASLRGTEELATRMVEAVVHELVALG